MASLDTLNDGQRAVLQLLLRQGRSYDDIARLLKSEPARIRARARGAVAAVGPDAGEIGAERRDEIADYLLGQQTASQRAATREYLEGSAPGRVWARSAVAALEPVGGDRLPAIPGERAEVAGASGTPDRRAALQEKVRSSQLGTKLLVAGAGVIVGIAVILALSLGGGKDPAPQASTTPSPTSTAAGIQTTPTGDKYVIVSQGTLLAPEGADKNAKGTVAIFNFPESNQYRFGLQATGLRPDRKGAAYGVWLYSSADKKQFLGFPDTRVGKDGKLETVADLSPNTPAYAAVLLTRETAEKPTKPGKLVLVAEMVTGASRSQQQTQTQTTPTP